MNMYQEWDPVTSTLYHKIVWSILIKNVTSKTIFHYKESDKEITILKQLPVYVMR